MRISVEVNGYACCKGNKSTILSDHIICTVCIVLSRALVNIWN